EAQIGEVAETLRQASGRLREILEETSVLEEDAAQLIKRAEEARASLRVNEEDAKKIAALLGSETELKLREEISQLKQQMVRQDVVRIQDLKASQRSARRSAVLSLAVGTLIGIPFGLLVNWLSGLMGF